MMRYGHPSTMGALVVVTATMERIVERAAGPLDRGVSLPEWHVWKPAPIEPRSGWIVGCRSLRNGRYVAGGTPSYGLVGDFDPPDYEESVLADVSAVPVYLVAWWPGLAHVRVSPDHVTPWTPLDRKPQARTSAHERELAAHYAAHPCDYPRDARGRFCK